MTVICSNCGAENEDGSLYCGTCGTALGVAPVEPVPAELAPAQQVSREKPVPEAPKPRVPKRTRNIVIAADVVIIIIVIAFALSFARGSSSTVTQTQGLSIVNGSVSLGKASYQYFQFTVPSGAIDTQVKGSFEVSGSAGSDIRAYIMDNVNLFVWANSHGTANVTTYYKSGLVNSGEIKASIPSGSYYLIFDNSLGTSPNVVNANVSLVYNQPTN